MPVGASRLVVCRRYGHPAASNSEHELFTSVGLKLWERVNDRTLPGPFLRSVISQRPVPDAVVVP